jgi:hypothetical protein
LGDKVIRNKKEIEREWGGEREREREREREIKNRQIFSYIMYCY